MNCTQCSEEAFVWDKDYDISLMSFNIRYDEWADGEHRWDNRKEACISMWNRLRPSVVGIQEGLQHQVNYLDENLPDYDFVGVGRDDGIEAGEFAAIFYLKDEYEILDASTFWLSETPGVPSLGWDANNIRIVTWAMIRERSSARTFYVFNTHFDHKGKVARLESARLLVQKIKEVAHEDAPVFITGDFNAWAGNSMFEPITEVYFDARRFSDYSDNQPSFNLWGKWYANWSVDYIFYINAKSLAFRTVNEDYGVPFLSDHYPLMAHFDLLQ